MGTPPLLRSLEAWFHILERKDCKRQDDGQGNDIDGGGKRGNEGATDCAGYVAAFLGDRAADGNGYRRFKAVVVFHAARAGVALAAYPDCAGIAGGTFAIDNLSELQPLQLGTLAAAFGGRKARVFLINQIEICTAEALRRRAASLQSEAFPRLGAAAVFRVVGGVVHLEGLGQLYV